ncbi:autotransporter outer membrane beta-barrel domain-containing protein [Pseudomonas sp. MAFF 301350]|uniref:Autotransporter outer membrane beta-barrel domain-containing protein n=1 Tax=Pseudomonas aegrilactucae TaxID=2854028 RepID=A0A9Q2XPY9_9PSED|nr:autotransporter outer membrane beta-barrel domain-containing protein [Pseudomonas aegrilactucae]
MNGNNFTLLNDGSVVGGKGGAASMSMMPGTGSLGGSGGAGVSGDGFVVYNTGTIRGGDGGTPDPLMLVGSKGGSGISGQNFEVNNATGATIDAGINSGNWANSAPAIQSSGGSTIYNAGTIGSSAPFDTSIKLEGGNNTLVLANGSNIRGSTVAGSADTFALGGSADSALNVIELTNKYIGFGTFDKRASSTWTLSGTSVGTTITQWNVRQGTLRTTNGTTLTGSVAVQQNGTLQLGNTRIDGDLVNNGTLQLGHATAPRAFVSVDGNFSQGSNGVYRIAAESNDSEGGYSRLSASGNVSLAGNAAVDVAQVNRLAIGQSLDNVVYTRAELSGNFAKVTDNSALFDFKSVATNGTGGHVDFQVVQAKTIVDIVDGGTKPKPPTTPVTPTPTPEDNEPAINSNKPARGAAQVLDTIIGQGTNNAGMQQVITSLGKLNTNQQVSDAVSQTLPLLVGSSQAAANASLTAINDVVQARVSQGRGLSSGDEVLGDRELWVKTFGSWGDQNERNGVSGFEVNSQGIVFGADAAINPQSRVGLAFAYAKSDINGDSKAAPNSADMDMYQLIGYGSYDLDDATQLTYQLDYGQGRTDGKRQILFMGTEAKAKYDSQIVHAGVALGHTLRLGEATELTPSVRADYTWVEDEGYRETGAGALNLDVDRRDSESLVLGADAELVHLFSDRLSTRLKLGVGYDTIGERASLTSAYAGAPGLSFRTQGLDASPWLGRGGVGVSYRVTDSTELSADYDAEYREDFLNQSASLKVRWAF